MSSTRPLFGGAITSTIPADLLDASELRQVPDTQEVFLSPDSDLSLIVEVVEFVTEEGAGESVEAALKFHYSSLAHDNTALSSTTTGINLPTPASASAASPVVGPATLTGQQVISKFNKGPEDADTVLILLALWRIPSKQADLTLCVNFPLKKAGEEAEASGEYATRVFEEAVSSLKVEDLGLFAGGQ